MLAPLLGKLSKVIFAGISVKSQAHKREKPCTGAALGRNFEIHWQSISTLKSCSYERLTKWALKSELSLLWLDKHALDNNILMVHLLLKRNAYADAVQSIVSQPAVYRHLVIEGTLGTEASHPCTESSARTSMPSCDLSSPIICCNH